MIIGISLHSTREVLFLLSSPLLEYLKEDENNSFIIFAEDPQRLKPLIKGTNHIKLESYYSGNKIKKLIFYLLIQPYEKMALLNQKLIGDHLFIIKETWSFNKTTIILGKIFCKVPFYYRLYKIFKYFSFKTDNYEDYKIDKWLITEYHHFNEKVISYNHGEKTSFFPPSHDSYSIDGIFGNEIRNYFVWGSQDKLFAEKICNLPEKKIITTGNPYLEKIRKYHPYEQVDNQILFLASNNFVYNEVAMVENIKSNKFLDNLGINLRISPGVGGVGKEWNRRKDAHTETLGKDNVLMPSGEWFGEEFNAENLNEDYYLSLWKHKIFIVPGVSNIAYDILARGGILVLMFYKDSIEKNKFPWWTCEEREVLDHVKSLPGVIVCQTAMELEDKLKQCFSNNINSSNTAYTKDINSSKIIFNELLKE